ncbi:pseudouridine synthase [Sphingomonas sp. KR1UV-12]|uniref:Pseudouridine synthase n=1 Tax=Sphingomonas aurea TaxID=3063994 RepID=A0ABT9EHU4_9SPHN|nr:pseudouridine synthase [Sphingomonas sp. KR1UV-12]MDP1026538.1 pseudouridine synthase [Sphingomonas sp. KR1UV-12]
MKESNGSDGARAHGDRPAGDRIAKLLARAGIASRREIERMIAEGRIALNGIALDTPATVLRSLNGITVDGQPVAAPAAAQLFVYHKPPGLLVTERDPAGRPTIYDRLPADLPRLVPVGRLDLATEGLLLLTTDGGLKRQLELPATGVERTYRARAYGEITQAMLEELIEGCEIDGVRYGSIDANLERRTGANVWIELTLTEGKNREVRRVLEYLGLQVSRLIRTRYGPFILGDLPVGEIGEVRQNDLVAFRQTLGPRRPKGADLGATVAVTAREKAPPPPPPAPPERRPERPRPTAAAAKPARTASWGTHARPNAARSVARPADDAAATPSRGRRPLANAGPRERSPLASTRAPQSDQPRDEAPRGRAGRTQGDPRADRPARSSGPAKGPAGGRGHPPRGSKPSTRGGSGDKPSPTGGKPRGGGRGR